MNEHYRKEREEADRAEAWRKSRFMGLTRADLDIPMPPMQPALGFFETVKPRLFDAVKDMLWKHKDYGAQWLYDHGHDLMPETEMQDWTDGEILRYWTACQWLGRFQSGAEKRPVCRFLYKIKNSAWRWGCYSMPYHMLLRFHRMFLAFDWGMPDFEVRYDQASYTNEKGWSVYSHSDDKKTSTYIDGCFALMILYKGKHVLTISVSPTEHGLYVHQVQLKQRKGNRWLFQLPQGYLDYALGRVYAACQTEGIPVFLVTGEASTESTEQNYLNCQCPQLPWRWNTEKPRLTAFYNQPLADFNRVQGKRRLNRSSFLMLEPKSGAADFTLWESLVEWGMEKAGDW